MDERFIPKPSGVITEEEITRVRRVMVHRQREQQPQVNQILQDTIPGEGSGDQ